MRRVFCLGLLALALHAGVLHADSQAKVLRVGIHEKPPYATKSKTGEWNGIGVDLWNSIALRTGIPFEFVETPYERILSDLGAGDLDAAVGEIEVSADSEKIVDFTQPYLMSSIGIALQEHSWHPDIRAIVGEFFNWTILLTLLGIFVGMLVVSALIWILERHHQSGHFRGSLTGLGSALWFSAVTMTTVGYGDKTPSTLAGRLIAFVWMLVGVLLVAGFTAAVTSSLAAARVSEIITRPGDLYRMSCGVMAGSVPQQFLAKQGIPARPYESVESALAALSEGKIQAVVGDRISLRYLHKKMTEGNSPVHFRVSNVGFQDIFIGVPVRAKLPEFEAINVALLQTISSDKWQETLRQWLGRDRE